MTASHRFIGSCALVLLTLMLGACGKRSNTVSIPKKGTAPPDKVLNAKHQNQDHQHNKQHISHPNDLLPIEEHHSISAGQQRLSSLERRIAELEHGLKSSQLAQGKGAYRHGPLLSVDGNRNVTMLERLHQLEEELAQTQNNLETRIARINHQQNQLSSAEEHIAALNESVALLRGYRERTQIAQQELQERQKHIDKLIQQRDDALLKHLQSDRLYAEYALELLKIRSIDADSIADLQDRLRSELSKMDRSDIPNTIADANSNRLRNQSGQNEQGQLRPLGQIRRER